MRLRDPAAKPDLKLNRSILAKQRGETEIKPRPHNLRLELCGVITRRAEIKSRPHNLRLKRDNKESR